MVKIKPKGKETHLTLAGRLTIEHAKELHEALKKALEGAQRLEISLEGAEAVDLSCLQLLCSANRTARASKKNISLKGRAPECFKRAAVEAGFFRQEQHGPEKDDDCFWLSNWET